MMPLKDPEKQREYYKKWLQKPESMKKRRVINQRYRQTSEVKARSRKRRGELVKNANDPTRKRDRSGKKWTEQEIMLLWDTSHTAQELAVKLRRSYLSIRAARHRFSTHQPKDYCHIGDLKVEHFEPTTESKAP